MFEKFKYKLHKDAGIFTEYDQIKEVRRSFDRESINNKLLKDKIENVVNLLECILDEIEKGLHSGYIPEYSTILRGEIYEIERYENICKKITDERKYIESVNKLNDMKKSLNKLLKSLVVVCLNKISTGDFADKNLVINYKNLVSSLCILMNDCTFINSIDSDILNIINMLLNNYSNITYDYDDLEYLQGYLKNMLSNLNTMSLEINNTRFSFENSRKVKIYDALDEKKKR